MSSGNGFKAHWLEEIFPCHTFHLLDARDKFLFACCAPARDLMLRFRWNWGEMEGGVEEKGGHENPPSGTSRGIEKGIARAPLCWHHQFWQSTQGTPSLSTQNLPTGHYDSKPPTTLTSISPTTSQNGFWIDVGEEQPRGGFGCWLV